MADPIYVVTLKGREDLDKFYSDMKSDGYKIQLKRPLSRNTHYYMTDLQAENLRGDSRVLAVEKRPEDIPYLKRREHAVTNLNPHVMNGLFRKQYSGWQADDKDWGKLHTAGTDAQRNKGTFGDDGTTTQNDSVTIFNGGKHVDVVICDNTVAIDCGEWQKPSSTDTRFVQYEWYNELNQYVGSIDDDSLTLPTGNIDWYISNAVNTSNHGTHCAGTIAGKTYGWAPEANIYALQLLSGHTGTNPVPNLLEFDYLRAFHANKPINQETGQRNATISSHSWGFGYDLSQAMESTNGFSIEQVLKVEYAGVTYDKNNPPAGGWNFDAIKAELGFGYEQYEIPSYYQAMVEDAMDAVEDGIIVIAAASNDNFQIVPAFDWDNSTPGSQHPNWNDRIWFQGVLNGSYYYHRGSAPGAAGGGYTPGYNPSNAPAVGIQPGVICVGSMHSKKDFRRSAFSNYGERIDVWAPGQNICSATNNSGTADTKYGGSNWFQPKSGTSMATPQLSGIMAMHCSNDWRMDNGDVRELINKMSKEGDMDFDIASAMPYPKSHAVAVSLGTSMNTGINGYAVMGYTIDGYYDGPIDLNLSPYGDPIGATVRIWLGDTIYFYLGYNGDFNNIGAITAEPFEVRDALGGAQVSNPVMAGQGSTSGNVFWTPSVIGTYYYQSTNDPAYNGKIEVLNLPGSCADPASYMNPTCSKGSPNKYILGGHTRPTSGQIGVGDYKGERSDKRNIINASDPWNNNTHLLYPRPKLYHTPCPGNHTYTLDVTAPNMSVYRFTGGQDRVVYHNNADNPDIIINLGDILMLNMNAAGHPLWITSVQGTGTPPTNAIPPGITGNGTASSADAIIWDTSTSGVTVGTYYYNCESHAAMTGIIDVKAFV